MENKFWFIIREKNNINWYDHNPTIKHETLGSALVEAKRLCETINDTFYVAEVVGYFSCPPKEVIWNTLS